ncbi:hypothetical protein GJAV_G00061680 [Gymnothorax javanicus]|nr:hypothetical protein GJAV_G00061680 [Gymnothorax javanicus]
MNSLLASTSSLLEMFDGKLQEFAENVDNTHMVWLEEIQQEAIRMFSCDFSAEPELMPKTPSQKKRGRKRISVGHYDNRSTRRFSKGKRSNLRTSLVLTQKRISEDFGNQRASSLEGGNAGEKPSKRNTRQNSRQKLTAGMEPGECETLICSLHETSPVKDDSTDGLQRVSLGTVQECLDAQNQEGKSLPEAAVVGSVSFTSQSCNKLGDSPEKLSVKRVSAAETLSEDLQKKGSSQCRTPRRSSVRHSLTLRRSLAGLRHSMTQESVRRASRRSFLKKKARMSSSTCSSSTSGGVCSEIGEEKSEEMMNNVCEHPAESQTDAVDQKVVEESMITESSNSDGIRRVTRSTIQAIPTQPLRTNKDPKLDNESSTSPESDDGGKKPVVMSSCLRSQPSVKRRAAEAAEEPSLPRKKLTPPKKCQSTIKPNMKSFLHTVQKNQLLMMTPGSLSQSSVKSFIKHTTPLRADLKPVGGLVERERLRLETLKKKQEQEIERKKKLEEEKRRKQEEMKRKRDERLRKVVEARVKEEQREEEKKKKIELKMAHMEEKNDKLRMDRLAEEKAKRKLMSKRQEELELRKKQEEEARRKKTLQAEEEKKQQELQMKRRAEEEQQKEREVLQEQKAAAEREKAEQEKALAEQRKLEKAIQEKEQREREEKEKEDKRLREIEQKKAAAIAAAARNVITVEIQKSIMKTPAGKAAGLDKTINVEKSTMKTPVGKAAGLNVTMDVETSPQSYKITPKGGNKPLLISANPDDYGMDQNSDDSTDDESAPRKPIPSWAEGQQLHQAMLHQYFNPVDVDSYFGQIVEPKLEEIFNKSKPRYFKRTSSAVWQSPPRAGHIAY